MRLLTAAILTTCLAVPARAAQEAPAPTTERRIVVLPTQNRTPQLEYDAVSDGLRDLLAILLAGQEGVAVLERAQLDRLLSERKLTLSGIAEPAAARDTAALLAAEFLVLSRVLPEGDGIAIAVDIVSVESGAVIAAHHAAGSPSELTALLARCAEAVARSTTSSPKSLTSRELDTAPQMSLRLARGICYMHQGRFERAQVEFMAVTLVDPSSPTARVGSARCFLETGALHQALRSAEALHVDPAFAAQREQVSMIISEARRRLDLADQAAPASAAEPALADTEPKAP